MERKPAKITAERKRAPGRRTAASALLQAGGSLNMYGRLFGLGQPLRKLETRAVGSDAQVVIAVDGAAVRTLMQKFLPPPPPPPPRTGQGWAERSAGETSGPRLSFQSQR